MKKCEAECPIHKEHKCRNTTVGHNAHNTHSHHDGAYDTCVWGPHPPVMLTWIVGTWWDRLQESKSRYPSDRFKKWELAV